MPRAREPDAAQRRPRGPNVTSGVSTSGSPARPYAAHGRHRRQSEVRRREHRLRDALERDRRAEREPVLRSRAGRRSVIASAEVGVRRRARDATPRCEPSGVARRYGLLKRSPSPTNAVAKRSTQPGFVLGRGRLGSGAGAAAGERDETDGEDERQSDRRGLRRRESTRGRASEREHTQSARLTRTFGFAPRSASCPHAALTSSPRRRRMKHE